MLLQRLRRQSRAASTSASLGTGSITISDDLAIGWFPLSRFVVAVAVLGALSLFLARTRVGRAFRATSDDPEAAQLMGIDNRTVYAVALGLAVRHDRPRRRVQRGPDAVLRGDGPELLIYAFEAVVIGGLGSLWGTLAGGVILGVAQTIGAESNSGGSSSSATSCSSPCSSSARPACSDPRTRT